ncbi:argininosuccinate lyase [Weeksellaceae bacterium A-14]|uniref:argininosuccinate lyase n=1 Tax=Daejeonia sp. YH14 TaxID=3439042 RepID=UPI0031E4A7B7
MEFKKLWAKDNANKNYQEIIEKFTVGKDRDFDTLLAKFDVIGNKAHVAMLNKIGFISDEENKAVQHELDKMLTLAENGALTIDDDVEDIHSQIEFNLTEKLGDAGKKIHTGRSRNDQVAVDIKLYLKSEIEAVSGLVKTLFETFISLADQYREILMPGYTHYQIAMPSSFGLWFSAFAESLSEDMELLSVAYSSASKNPLGSGAGYGSSFPLDRDFTTEQLGFKAMNVNSVYAQMTRGKSEKFLAFALASIAATIGKMANDVCLYSNQNYGFFSFPSELTTGSSIMPHKKNPDVFELIRGKSSRIQAVPNELTLLMNNLSTGYNREYQLTKEILFPAIQDLKDSLEIFDFMIRHIQVNEHILDDTKYDYLFSVEKINELMLSGKGFRDAYREVGNAIENGTYHYERKNLKHTHKGSIGNLALEEISANFYDIYHSIVK